MRPDNFAVTLLSQKSQSAAAEGGFIERFYAMLLGWGSVALVYLCTGWLSVEPAIIPEIWLDRQLTFSASAIWLYLSFFVLIPYTYFSALPKHLPLLRSAMQISAIISGLFFIFLPSSLVYPEITQQGFSASALRLLTAVDSANNCFPSLHASLTAICMICIVQERRLLRSVFVVILGVSILVSIIMLRRHLTIDVGAGVVLGIIAYALAGWSARRKKCSGLH